MINPDHRKWAKFQLTYVEGSLYVEYEDGLGNTTRNESLDGQVYYENNDTGGYFMHPRVHEWLNTALSMDPATRKLSGETIPVPLAIFLGNASQWRFYEDLFFLRTVFPTLENKADSWQYINFQPASFSDTFQLPFNIQFRGPDADSMLENFKSQEWYASNSAIQTHGIHLSGSADTKETADVLILQDREAGKWLSERSLKKVKDPRLLILLDPYPLFDLDLNRIRSLPFAVIFIPYKTVKEGEFLLREIINCILQDLSLHETVFYINRKHLPTNPSLLLFASPASNQGIRMSVAADSQQHKFYELSRTVNLTPGYIDLTGSVGKNYQEWFEKMRQSNKGSDTFANSFGPSTRSFRFEEFLKGFTDLAKQEKEFSDIEDDANSLKQKLQSIIRNPEIRETIRQKLERKADISLDEFRENLQWAPIHKYQILKPGKRFRVNVVIGQRSDYSIMTGEVPPIDLVLPDPEKNMGHELDIVLFPKSFTLVSESLQKIHLPMMGGSGIARFECLAPESTGMAALRICIFHKNTLLQAFILEATIAYEAENALERQLKCYFDLGTSASFDNINELPKRDLYIGINAAGNGSHNLFIKKDNVAEQINGITEAKITSTQVELQHLLENIYFKGRESLFAADPENQLPMTEAFVRGVNQMARMGKDLHDLIREGAYTDSMKDLIFQIQKNPGMTISIARHNSNYAFPWSLLYDYDLSPLPGFQHLVCTGEKIENIPDSHKRPGETYCNHNPEAAVICMEGFWGIRHQIEQYITPPEKMDMQAKLPVTKNSPIIYSFNINDQEIISVIQSLPQYKLPVKCIADEKDIFSPIWKKEHCPATLLVFGHLETKPKSDEPDEPRILSYLLNGTQKASEEKWYCRSNFSKFFKNNKTYKEKPSPLIFLISCSSNAPDTKTQLSLVKEFNYGGASTIIATECSITSGLGKAFVDHVFKALYIEGRELGEAIQDFNKKIFIKGNPLGFVFTCFGNLNLKIERI